MSDFGLWTYYSWRLPRLALGAGYIMPDEFSLRDEPHAEAGAVYLRSGLGTRFSSLSDKEIARRASWVRLWREAGAFQAACHVVPPQDVEGLEHVAVAMATGRPVVLLAAHVGNPYLACAALAASGYPVFPVARAVDRSEVTPLATQWFLRMNYWATERMLHGGRYLYTDFAGRFDRGVVEALLRPGALCVNLIDMPPTLYQGKRQNVNFLGRSASLPINFIRWAQRRHRAIFLTFWSAFDDGKSECGVPPLRVWVDPPIEEENSVNILQTYATRLEALIAEQPWGWMGLSIARQFHETMNMNVQGDVC